MNLPRQPPRALGGRRGMTPCVPCARRSSRSAAGSCDLARVRYVLLSPAEASSQRWLREGFVFARGIAGSVDAAVAVVRWAWGGGCGA